VPGANISSSFVRCFGVKEKPFKTLTSGGGSVDERGCFSPEFVEETGAGPGQEGQTAAGQHGGDQRDEKDPRANLQPLEAQIE